MSPRTLVVYYSRSGHTKHVAERIAGELDADLEAIFDRARRRGLLGYVRSGLEAIFDRLVELAPSKYQPAGYELVIIGTPVWNMSLASPVRAYLLRHRDVLPDVAFFCTFGGSGAERVLGQMTRVSGKQPVARLSLREDEVDRAGPSIEQFLARVRAALPPEVPAPPPAPGWVPPIG